MATEASRRATQKWAENNKDKIKEAYKKRREGNPEKFIWYAAKGRARKQSLPFDIEISDIIIPEYCPVLNIKLVQHSGRNGGEFDSASLDRIAPEKGYVKGNVQVISRLANAMKADATPDQLKSFANWINKTYD